MMNKKRLMAILAAGVLTATSFNPVMIRLKAYQQKKLAWQFRQMQQV